MSNTIYSTFRRWQVAALVFLVLFVVLATGIEAQDVDFSTNTPEGVATEVAPVVVVEVPTGETADEDDTAETVALIKDVVMWLVLLGCIFLVRDAVPQPVVKSLLEERRERAKQTETKIDDVAVEIVDKLLVKPPPPAAPQ